MNAFCVAIKKPPLEGRGGFPYYFAISASQLYLNQLLADFHRIIAFFAIHRAILGWRKGNLGRCSTISTDHLSHRPASLFSL